MHIDWVGQADQVLLVMQKRKQSTPSKGKMGAKNTSARFRRQAHVHTKRQIVVAWLR